MYGLGRTYGGKIAVTLIGEHQSVGVKTLGGGGHGGSASVSGLYPVNIYIVICEYCASHRSDADSNMFGTHLLYHFSHKFMNHTVAAAGAVVHGGVVEQRRLGVDFVLRALDFFLFHCNMLK